MLCTCSLALGSDPFEMDSESIDVVVSLPVVVTDPQDGLAINSDCWVTSPACSGLAIRVNNRFSISIRHYL
jgi:hypothetical protein